VRKPLLVLGRPGVDARSRGGGNRELADAQPDSATVKYNDAVTFTGVYLKEGRRSVTTLVEHTLATYDFSVAA
jgi:hypothetical protein